MSLPMWTEVLRKGLLPQLPTKGLVALRDALARDDKDILQGGTVTPPPLQCCAEMEVEACCPIAYTFWKGCEDANLVGTLEERFARACYECDTTMGEPASVRAVLNLIDDSPRSEMIAALLPEIDLELQRRKEMVTT